MTSDRAKLADAPFLSIGIFAWNEEEGIPTTLESLLAQDIYGHLRQRGLCCEVVCVANGCTDRTAGVAEEFLNRARMEHAWKDVLRCRVVDLKARGKVNAWNQFVHRLSAPGARLLCLMDADILIHRRATIRNLIATLEFDPQANVAVDVPRKHIAFKKRTSLVDALSLAASRMTLRTEAQLCAQLYCIRAEVARRIYLPEDLAACEDGFIKALVCTDFLAHAPSPARLRVAPDAEHTFEAYTTPAAILKNQKRQILGQTIVHILIDQYLPNLKPSELQELAQHLRAKDAADPGWLKRLIRQHLRTHRFWRLHPGLLGRRFRDLRRLEPAKRLRCLPAALAGSAAALAAGFLAYRSLKGGCTNYWPKAKRAGLKRGAEPIATEPIIKLSL